MKKTAAALILILAGLSFASQTYICDGLTVCRSCSGGSPTIASCYVERPSSSILYCETEVLSDSVTCRLKDESGFVVGVSTMYCADCPGSGGADPDLPGGEDCDVTIPFFWIYCDPFPL